MSVHRVHSVSRRDDVRRRYQRKYAQHSRDSLHSTSEGYVACPARPFAATPVDSFILTSVVDDVTADAQLPSWHSRRELRCTHGLAPRLSTLSCCGDESVQAEPGTTMSAVASQHCDHYSYCINTCRTTTTTATECPGVGLYVMRARDCASLVYLVSRRL